MRRLAGHGGHQCGDEGGGGEGEAGAAGEAHGPGGPEGGVDVQLEIHGEADGGGLKDAGEREGEREVGRER